MVLSGFIDLQVNGYHGVDFSSPDLSLEEVVLTAKNLYLKGIEAFMPTVITSPLEVYTHNLPLLAEAAIYVNKSKNHSRILGIHLEGPYISLSNGARGIHPVNHVRQPSISEFEYLFQLSKGHICLLTLAPELPGASQLIQFAVSLGVQIGIGHTLATSNEIQKAADQGATFSTHLGNGLPLLIHRHLNPLWSQLTNPALTALVIADGQHLPIEFLKVVITCKGIDNVIVTSDSSPVAGLPPGVYTFYETVVNLDSDGRLSDPYSGYLAGSSATLDECANWLLSTGLNHQEVSMLCKDNAKRFLGQDI